MVRRRLGRPIYRSTFDHGSGILLCAFRALFFNQRNRCGWQKKTSELHGSCLIVLPPSYGGSSIKQSELCLRFEIGLITQ